MSSSPCSNSPLWWHPLPSALPNPSQCIRLALIPWIPLIFFLALSPAFALQLWRIRKRAKPTRLLHALPLSPLLISKFGICLLLLILAAAQLFKLLDDPNDPIFVQFPWASISASIAKMANLLFLFVGLRLAQLHGLVSSGILHLSWILCLLCSFPDLYAAYQHFFTALPEPGTADSVHLFVWICSSLALSIQCVLFFFADPRHHPNPSGHSLLDNSTTPADGSPSPSSASSSTKISAELDSSFFSRLTYFWFRHLPSLGRHKDLTFEDLYELNEGSRARHLVPQWERSWLPAVERYYQRRREKLAQGLGQAILDGAGMGGALGGPVQGQRPLAMPKRPSVILALFKMFKWELIESGLVKAIADILQFANPFLLRQLITFVGAPDAQFWQGLALAFAMFFCSEIRSLCVNHYFFVMFRMGTKIQTALTAAIYKKSLQLSNGARRERTVGEIVNLMAIDVERFQMITPQIQQFWSSPLQIGLALVFLFNTLGIAALPGVVIMSIIIPLSFVSSFFTRRWQIKQMQQKDERTKLCNEILNGMKVIKLYAWEVPMMEAVERIRAKELDCLLKAGLVRSVIDTFNFTSPFLVAVGSFLTFCLLNPSSLTPQIAFVSLTLFNQLRSPMTMIGFLINMLVQTAVSNQRIKEFLLAEELDQNAVERGAGNGDIRLEGADFAWESAQPSLFDPKKKIRSQTAASQKSQQSRPPLQNINLSVQKGELVAVVGKVGAGKSSLLAAILGEMERTRGRVQIRQGISIGYVPQQAWIQNMSLRQNVTFGREFCPQLYEKVLDACALQADLDMLPQGDGTEIGEKGINLSGGQKARVALARAVYQQSDLYLLDDPLSAVDSHVGKWIFDKVIGPEGMLADRSRLLVTHRLHFLRKAHKIVLLEEGRIVESGTFEELAAFGGKFAELMAEGNLGEGGQEEEETKEGGGERMGQRGNEELEEKGEGEMVEELTSVEQIDKLTHQMSRQSSCQPNCHRRRQSQSISVKSGQSQRQNPKKSPEENGEGRLIEKERVETGRVKIGVYVEYMRAAGFTLSILFIFLFCANQGMQLGRNFWLSTWADENERGKMEGGGNGTGGGDEQYRLAIYAVFGIFEALFFFLALITLLFGSLSGSRNLHSPMLLRIMKAPMAFFDTTPIGRLLNRFGKDIEVADTILPLNVRYFVQCLTVVFATLLTICISTWVFAALIIPLFLFYYFTLRLYVPTSRQLKRLESSHRSPIYSHFGESIQGASSIRAFCRQHEFCVQMDQRVDGLIRIKYLSLVANRWLAIRLEFLGNCVVLFAALFGALSREWSFVSSAGLVGLSVSYALNITEVMNFAIRQISELETNIVSIERLKEYAEVETEAPWKVPGKEPPKGWPNRGEIRFDQYSTRYRSGLDLVLRNILAEIRPAERIGIVGRTGAGKSSLAQALFRVVEPSSGTIFIDGLDITAMGLHDLRSGLTIIPQEPVLFSGNLRFNLDPFNRHSDTQIWEALENSHLRDFIRELPAGLDYQISEGGENISVGQRQLLCLARALLRSTRILVLDEATASVDLSTDALIQETIRQKFRHCTVFTIAHRLETIMDYDRIIVLQQGKICEFDSPQTLLANRNSLFSSMVDDTRAFVENTDEKGK